MNFALHLTDKEVDYIFGVLAQRPWGEVAALMGNIKLQIDEQQQQQTRPAPAMTDNTVVRLNGAPVAQ